MSADRWVVYACPECGTLTKVRVDNPYGAKAVERCEPCGLEVAISVTLVPKVELCRVAWEEQEGVLR